MLVLEWLLIGFLTINLLPITSIGTAELQRGYAGRNSYISSIKLHGDRNQWATEVFDRIKIGSEGKLLDGSIRPIFVRESDLSFVESFRGLFYTKSEVAGVAYTFTNFCVILMKEGHEFTKEEFQTTLFHEYLHCNYYSHTADPNDLMYGGGTTPQLENYTEKELMYIKDLLEDSYGE